MMSVGMIPNKQSSYIYTTVALGTLRNGICTFLWTIGRHAPAVYTFHLLIKHEYARTNLHIFTLIHTRIQSMLAGSAPVWLLYAGSVQDVSAYICIY